MTYDGFKRTFGYLLFTGLCLSTAACGALGGGGDECTFTEDCAGTEVCYTGGTSNQCVSKCSSDSDCSGESTCTSDGVEKPEGKSAQKGCVPPASGGDEGGGPCTSNDDCSGTNVCSIPEGEDEGQCQPLGGGPPGDNGGDDMDAGIADDGGNQLIGGDDGGSSTQDAGPKRDGGNGGGPCGGCPDGQTCNPATMECESEGGGDENPKFIAVRDITKDENPDYDNCSTSGDPGTDLFAARLIDSSGNVKAWGSLVSADLKGESNENMRASAILNGNAPSLSGSGESACPADFSADTVATLGCGGWVGLEFASNGDTLELEEGMTLSVHEYGQQCGGSSTDHFEVLLCDTGTSSGDLVSDISACSTTIASGPGVVSGNITSSLLDQAKGN